MHTDSGPPVLSVVIPVYNEESVLHILHDRLQTVLSQLHVSYEIVFIDDGSQDQTVQLIKALRSTHPEIGLVKLSRNFGKEVALSAGLHASRGEAVIVLDADLQDPPELIPDMLKAWKAGVDIVIMKRRSRLGEHWFKRWSAHVFYRLLNKMSDVPIPEDVGDFRLMSRRATDALNSITESNRYMKGLFAWIGFEQTIMLYDRAPRAAGVAKQNYTKLFGLAFQAMTSFSVKPLRIASLLGVLCALFAFLLMLFYLVKTFFYGESVRGFPTLIVALFLLGGLQLLGIGILGEYLGKMFIETKRRPLYLVDEQLRSHPGPPPSP
jgi:glycosyltransferase involved in cell wall biosynthesis